MVVDQGTGRPTMHASTDEMRASTDEVFRALADATRRDIVARTLSSEQSVSALAAAYPMSFAAVQKHVAVLERAGVVAKRRRGREQLVSARMDAIREARVLLDQYEQVWRDRLIRFGDVLAHSIEGDPS